MKVVLLYWTWTDRSRYGEIFHQSGSRDEWHYPLKDDTHLPLGTEIDINNIGGGISLKVYRHRYSIEDDVLRVQVKVVEENAEMNPEEFQQYIKTKWMDGPATDLWIKQQRPSNE